MVDQAKQPRAFQGKAGELFIESLIDAIQALLQAPVSPETQAAFEAVRRKNWSGLILLTDYFLADARPIDLTDCKITFPRTSFNDPVS